MVIPRAFQIKGVGKPLSFLGRILYGGNWLPVRTRLRRGAPNQSGQGDNEVSSSDQVEQSCAHSTSTLTSQDARRLVDRYNMEVVVLQELGTSQRVCEGLGDIPQI